MSLKRTLKETLIRLLAPYGYTVTPLRAASAPAPVVVTPPVVAPIEPPKPVPPTPALPVEQMDTGLGDILKRKLEFKTLVDIGASDGRWTAMALRHFPQHNYLLVEAQPVHVPALEKFKASQPNVQLALAAAGESPGTINFDATDPFGGIASVHPFPANNIVVPVTTLDHEIRTRNLEGPFLIKFDTHGFEVPILNGAAETLEQTAVIIIECYNFRIAPPCLLFHEMCALLEKKGFRCIDLIDPTRRPLDNCLWQLDLVFARNTRAEFSQPRYQ